MTSSIRAVSKGFSLVELMTAMAVSLIVVAAAAVLFAETGQNQRALDQISNANEVGSFVLRLVGRDLANAGFYPVEAGSDGAGGDGLGVYVKPTTGLPPTAAYDTGLFGCASQQFNIKNGSCINNPDSNSDSLVVSYYTTDHFGDTGIGHQLDCGGNDVATSPVNVSASTPAKALFVANHYHLGPEVSMTFNGKTVKTRSFRCLGLRDTGYKDLISGLDDFKVTYGVATDTSVLDKSIQFFGADHVADWQRVVAVRVCVISRTYETSGVSVGGNSWTDCDGNEQTAPAKDFSVRKTYTQIFGIKNHQMVIY